MFSLYFYLVIMFKVYALIFQVFVIIQS